MSTLSNVRSGLKTRLETISGLRVFDTWPDTVIPPCAIIRLAPGSQPHTTFSGNGSHNFEITVLVQISTLDRAQEALDLYIDHSGDSSIIAALEGSNTLGGNCEYFLTGEWDEPTVREVGSGDKTLYFFGSVLPVEVHITY